MLRAFFPSIISIVAVCQKVKKFKQEKIRSNRINIDRICIFPLLFLPFDSASARSCNKTYFFGKIKHIRRGEREEKIRRNKTFAFSFATCRLVYNRAHVLVLQSTNDNNKTECLGCSTTGAFKFTFYYKNTQHCGTPVSMARRRNNNSSQKAWWFVYFWMPQTMNMRWCAPRSCLFTVGQILSVAKSNRQFYVVI